MERNVYLKSPNEDKPQILLFRKKYLGNAFKYSLKVKIHPKDWDSTNRVVLPSRENHSKINKYIDKMLEEIESAFWEVMAEDCRYNQDKIKEILDKKVNIKHRF